MWWLFGLINVIIVMGFAWFYHKKIKEEVVWLREEKVALGNPACFSVFNGYFRHFCFHWTVGISHYRFRQIH